MRSNPEKGNAPEISPSEASIEVFQTSKKGISMSNFTPALTIGGATVRRAGDLFSLNDLHKAAGGEAKHKPSEWLRNQQAQDLLEEIQKAGIPAITSKPKVGTYACRELVIAYAAWISATFHLKVIRVFLAATTPQPAPYTIQPGDKLSEQQQTILRNMLESNVKRLPHAQQAGAMVKGWSKLKAHFGVPYRQIPASEFTEAISIVARHVSEWELVDDSPAPHQMALPQDDSIDVAALLLSGQCDSFPLTAAQEALIDQHAGRLMGEVYPLIRTHLKRRVAWHTSQARRTDLSNAAIQAILGSITLGNCLVHQYRNEVEVARLLIQTVRQRLDVALGSIHQPLGLTH